MEGLHDAFLSLKLFDRNSANNINQFPRFDLSSFTQRIHSQCGLFNPKCYNKNLYNTAKLLVLDSF